MELKPNQSALILTTDEHGEINVNVASGDHYGLTASICVTLAKKLMGNPEFQEEIMDMLEAKGTEQPANNKIIKENKTNEQNRIY